MMSQDAALFLIVEGRDTDQWFYEKLAKKSPKLKKYGYQVWRIESISVAPSGQATGGKQAILKFRDQLLANGGLTVSTRRGPRSVMFCLDSDHDRLARTAIRCRHVTYTQLPDAEAHVLDAADIGEALASAMSLSDQRKSELLASLGDMRGKLAEKWAEWFLVCALNGVLGARNGVRPGTPGSAVKPSYAKISKRDVKSLKETIVVTSGISGSEALHIERELESEVRRLIASGEARQLIKGKWLAEYIAFEANKYARKNHLRRVSADQIHSAARAIAVFRDPWLSYFRRRASALL